VVVLVLLLLLVLVLVLVLSEAVLGSSQRGYAPVSSLRNVVRANTEIVYDPKMGQRTIRPQEDKFGNTRRDNHGNLATSLAVGTRGGGDSVLPS
jgi:hypothetical protein